MPLLEVANLRAGYGSRPVLHAVDLVVEPGEIVALLGANGAGKTTTLRAISGTVERTGTLRFGDHSLIRCGPADAARAGIAHVPEGRGTMAKLSVQDNLQLGAYVRRDRGIASDMERVFAYFPVLKERRRQDAGMLSGGEQQMLAIGRALMMQPKLLILDEPTLGLAPVILEQLSKALERLRQTTDITVLLGEQNVTFALPHADRVYVLEHARIVWEGDPGRFAVEAGAGYL